MKFLIFLLLCISLQSIASIEFEDYSVSENPDWTVLNLKDSSTLRAAFEAPSKKSTFTIREFYSLKETSLKKNVSKWLTDYKSYGFTISDNKPLKLSNNTYGYLIEALHKKSGKIFKQYMSIQGDKLVTLTCHSDRVDEEFKACSDSLKSFSWKN